MFSRAGKQPSALLVLADIKSGEQPQQELRQRLKLIGDDLRNDRRILFHNTKTVHYAAWMILPEVKDCGGRVIIPARLALETNYDGCLEAHLRDLVKHCRLALDHLYDFCPDYPSAGRNRTDESVQKYLYDRCKDTESSPLAYYVALPGRTVEDIRNAISVYEEAKCFVDTLDKSSDSETVRSALIEHFRNSGVIEPRRFPVTQKRLKRRLVLSLPIGIPLMLLYAVLFWVPLCLIARLFEKREECDERKHPLFDPTGHGPEYTYLDLGRQNHICTFATVKPSAFRMFVVRSALFLGRILFRRFFILGKLDQMTTVHFARWTLLGRQLLFYGNYDGSWSSYLSDFSDQAWGVNLIWGNTIGFPQTRFLSRGGASDLEGFQAQAATHYLPAPVFYSAYRNYSLNNILRYLKLRDELAEAVGM